MSEMEHRVAKAIFAAPVHDYYAQATAAIEAMLEPAAAGEMVERVAAAIIQLEDDMDQNLAQIPYQTMARVAISAMREPTPEMLVAGMKENDCTESEWANDVSELEAEWRAMIDAALEERNEVAK